MSAHALFQPLQIGALTLPNRMVMAPLTRNRADANNVPTALMAEYYTQRATAGLIIAEATQVCPEGQGYLQTPGIHDAAQVAGWKQVTDAVHAANGRIGLQLWHVGRISHTSLQPNGIAPVAPSAIQANAQVFTASGFEATSMPRALETDEVAALAQTYADAARNALAAGFDFIEVHSANGYLLDQFLRDSTNQRSDRYGGSVDNRMRLTLEVLDAVIAVAGADRVGIRLSPTSGFNDISDSNPQATFDAVAAALGQRKIAYLHLIEGQAGGERVTAGYDPDATLHAFRAAGGQNVMLNNGYTRAMAEDALQQGRADLVSFGVPFIANPDLVARFQQDAALNAPRPELFYGGGAEGYTDYPTL